MRSEAKAWILGVTLLVLLLGACTSTAQSQQQSSLDRPLVAWAGLSLSGADNKLAVLYPRSQAYLERANRQLYQQAQTLSPPHYVLVTDDKVDLRKGNSLALTLALDSETVVVRQLAGLYQAVVEISATLLVYDVDSEEKAVVASFPLGLGPYVETYERSRPTEKQLSQLVEGYFFGGLSNLETGLIGLAVNTMQTIDIKYRYAAKIGIGNVAIDSGAAAIMAPTLGDDKVLMQSYLARQTARLLSNQQQVSVIPYQVDNAVTQMTLRFTGKKTTLLLALPEPDYQLNINLERFARKLTEKNKHAELYIYAARATLSLEDDFGDQIFEESLKDYVHKKVLLSQQQIDEWAVYQGALENLTSGFLQQLSQPQEDWFKLQGFSGDKRKQVQSGLLAVADVLEQCR
ncbi:MAG: hypothetical protein CMK89_14600 [Pseudomonadales bacterium]|nr:hypothetical protein [Pseudomonadales bacterium]RLU01942.1 MAG: hypothetical protein D9N11_11255 [Ketobacter sp.]